MVTKAIIVELINKYQARVRIPIYNKAKSSVSATPDEDLSISPICTIPGASPNYSVGDIVIVAFEQDIFTAPVILGLLYNTPKRDLLSDYSIGTLDVRTRANLPGDITIGNITYEELKTLANIQGNIQNQLSNLSDKIDNSTNHGDLVFEMNYYDPMELDIYWSDPNDHPVLM